MNKTQSNIKLKNNFINYLSNIRHLSDATISAYSIDLIQFEDFLCNNHKGFLFVNVKSSHIQSFMSILSKKGVANRTLARKLATLKSFYAFLFKNKIIISNICKNIKSPKVPKILPQYLNVNEINNLLDYPYGVSYNNKRDRAILELFYATGIRISELANIKIQDLQLEKKSIRILGKGDKERIVLFGSSAKDVLCDFLEIRIKNKRYSNSPYLFNQMRKTNNNQIKGHISVRTIFSIVKKYIKKISNNEKLSPHSLRHTFATHLLNNGADLMSVKDLLGHSSLSSTQLYTHVKTDKLKSIYNLTHPYSKK